MGKREQREKSQWCWDGWRLSYSPSWLKKLLDQKVISGRDLKAIMDKY
jgi:hypothetical protein